jgi:HEAT repeat protein
MGRVYSPPGWSFPFACDEGLSLAVSIRGMGPGAVQPVIAALDHEQPFARATAAFTLALFAQAPTPGPDGTPAAEPLPIPPTREVVTRLVALLDDDHAAVRSAAAMALATVEPGDEQADAVIDALIGRLGDPSLHVRGPAAQGLARFGPRAKAAAGPLGEWFRTRRSGLGLAAEALGALGPEAAPAVPILIEAARDKQSETREYAIVALGQIGPGVEGVLPALRAAMADPDDRVRSRASEALAKIDGPEIPRLIEALDAPDARVRKVAADSLGGMGPAAAPAVPALITRLADEHEGVLWRVLHALTEIGAPAVPALSEALGHEDARIRLGAVESLGRIGMPAASAAGRVATLRAGDPDPEVRRYAALALAALRPGEQEGVAALAEAIRDEHSGADQRLHRAACAIAHNLGKLRTKEATTALIEVLARLDRDEKDQTRQVPEGLLDNTLGRMIVEGVLEQVGPEALPVLLEALGRAEVQKDIAVAFRKIGAPAVPALVEALQSDEATRRAGAAHVFWTMALFPETREHTPPAVPALLEALKDQDPRVRAEAASALGQIGPEGARATLLLVQQLSDPDEQAADSAARALTDMKPEPGCGVPALVALLAKPDLKVRRRAVEALGKIGLPAIPGLLEILKDGDLTARRGAAEALREMAVNFEDPEAEEMAGVAAIPLAEALKDEDRWVRQCVGYALACLDEAAAPALHTLIALLDNPSRETRVASMSILHELGAPAVPSLLKALEDADPVVRSAAASSLGVPPYSPPPGAEVIAALLRALEDRDARVREAAAASLGSFIEALLREADQGTYLIEEMCSDLDLPGGWVRHAKAVAGIAYISGVGRRALRVARVMSGEEAASRWVAPLRAGLTAALDDSDSAVRLQAARSLGRMGERARRALDPLLAHLTDPDEDVRSTATEAISGLGAAAVPPLTRLLGSDDARVRAAAAAALGRVNPAEAIRPALDSLIEALEDSDTKVREQVVRVLAGTSYYDRDAFRRLAPRMADPLLRGLKHPDVAGRRAASYAFEWAGPLCDRDAEIIPALIAALEDPDPEVRKNAAVALRAFEDRALGAIPALKRAAKDVDDSVRSMAGNAISVILH